jgi:hypothetical protein
VSKPLSLASRRLLATLKRHADPATHRLDFPSYAQLALELECARRSLVAEVRALETAGLIKVSVHWKLGHRTNVYTAQPPEVPRVG